MTATLISQFGPYLLPLLALIGSAIGAYVMGHKRGAAVTQIKADAQLATAKAEAAQMQNANAQADAKAATDAREAVQTAAQIRTDVETQTAALDPSEAQKELFDEWSRK